MYSSRARPLPFPPTRSTSSFRSRQIVTHQNQLREKVLLELLDVLQRKLIARRGKKTTLVVHGGLISVLNHKHRSVTTDIDFIERMLPEELNLPVKKSTSGFGSQLIKWIRLLNGRKVPGTRTLLRECISETAADFNIKHSHPLIFLEHDWMNSAADVALPWYLDSESNMVDPLVLAAVREAQTKRRNIVYDSPGLCLIGITSSWTFALKFQRYSHVDESDIIALLQAERACAHYAESDFVRMLEDRLRRDCAEMKYEYFPVRAMREWRARLRDCVRKARYRLGVQRNAFD